MKNDGKAAESAFEKYWASVGHVERLRDRRDLIGLNGGKHVADFKKPSDFLVSSKLHNLHYAEVKSTTSNTSFSFSGIQDGQHKAAMLEASRGSQSYAFYIFSYPLGRWFIMGCEQYRAAIDDGKRSIKFTELNEWLK